MYPILPYSLCKSLDIKFLLPHFFLFCHAFSPAGYTSLLKHFLSFATISLYLTFGCRYANDYFFYILGQLRHRNRLLFWSRLWFWLRFRLSFWAFFRSCRWCWQFKCRFWHNTIIS